MPIKLFFIAAVGVGLAACSQTAPKAAEAPAATTETTTTETMTTETAPAPAPEAPPAATEEAGPKRSIDL